MSKLFTICETVKVGMEVVEGEVAGRKLHGGLQRLVTKTSVGMKKPRCHVVAADLQLTKECEQWITEQNEWDKRAIVYLHIPQYDGVSTTLLASTKQEQIIKPTRVLRRYRTFEEAVGCTLLARDVLDNMDGTVRANEYLIEMQPGACFIIQRAGALQGAPAELTIRWNGHWDLRGVNHMTDVLNPDRYAMSLFSRGRHHNRHHSVAATMPSFQAR